MLDTTINSYERNISTPAEGDPLTLDEYREIFYEIEEQPYWRAVADKEMDYADGNQLDSDLLRKQRERGIPPAVEDLIGPALLSLQGYEATIRTDWRVTPNGQEGGKDIADAISFKLNEAERHSKADRACSDAFRAQAGCGIGWVEVARESDPFKYPHRCTSIHRNEIDWDMKAREPDLSDARWLRRRRWLAPDRLALVFPDHKELFLRLSSAGANWINEFDGTALDGGQSTGLQNAWDMGRAWTLDEQHWYNPTTKELCVSEVWYRRWVRVPVIKTPDGRAVEYDEDNLAHAIAVASGRVSPRLATVTRIRRAYWIGQYQLHDAPTPYTHRHFPYVPFWGFREDMTGVPYGYVRGMKYAQDSLNSGISKLRWGVGVTRVERTEGAVAMPDDTFRRMIARPDADVKLDRQHMASPGARFEVKRDFELSDQHLQLIENDRNTIQRVSNITAGFMGKTGTATSGLQEQTQVEQSNQSLGRIMDNFREARTMVGELLMAMIVEDMGDQPQTVIVEGDAVKDDRTVAINAPEVDPATGERYLSNDLQRTRLKVGLEDVPKTHTYRGQQLNAMSEAVKALPPQYQAAIMPFMVSLMDVPHREDVVEAIRNVQMQGSPEEVNKRIQEAVKEALDKSDKDLKARELDIKERESQSKVKEMDAKAVQIGVQAAFSAMQSGAQIATMPQIAPIADEVMKGAGYQRPDPAGVDPNYPQPQTAGAMDPALAPDVNTNTSPQFPPVPDDGDSPMEGIETTTTTDNMSGVEQ